MDIVGAQIVVELRGDGVGLGDLLGFQAAALEHVQEIGIAADVKLAGALKLDAAFAEQAGQDAVGDRRADL